MALLIVEARKANNDEGTDRVAVHLPALMLTGTDGRMTGEATLIECEGRTTWTAEFVRR